MSMDTDTATPQQEARACHSENVAELIVALAKAQSQFTNPDRNREVAVKTRAGDTYKFRYATLDAIMNVVRKPLAENGLALVHFLREDCKGPVCETRLFHVSGQWIATWVPLLVADDANIQGWGSALTYSKRYGLCALLAITADEDDDGNHACGNEVAASDRQSARRAKAPPQGNGNPQPSKASAERAAERAAAWQEIEAAEKWSQLTNLFDRLKAAGFPPPVFAELMAKWVDKAHSKLMAQAKRMEGDALDKLTTVANTYFPDGERMSALTEITARRDELALLATKEGG